MALSPLARSAGPLALGAGALFTLTQLVMYTRIMRVDYSDLSARGDLFADPIYLGSGAVYSAVFCLLVIALVAIYGRVGHRAGALWTFGFCAALVGTVSSFGNVAWADVFAMPWVVAVAPEVLQTPPSGTYVAGAVASYLLFSLGWVFFGLASLRARVFPAAICVAIAAGGLLGYNASPPYGVLFGLAFAALGLWMLQAPVTAGTSLTPAPR